MKIIVVTFEFLYVQRQRPSTRWLLFLLIYVSDSVLRNPIFNCSGCKFCRNEFEYFLFQIKHSSICNRGYPDQSNLARAWCTSQRSAFSVQLKSPLNFDKSYAHASLINYIQRGGFEWNSFVDSVAMCQPVSPCLVLWTLASIHSRGHSWCILHGHHTCGLYVQDKLIGRYGFGGNCKHTFW